MAFTSDRRWREVNASLVEPQPDGYMVVASLGNSTLWGPEQAFLVQVSQGQSASEGLSSRFARSLRSRENGGGWPIDSSALLRQPLSHRSATLKNMPVVVDLETLSLGPASFDTLAVAKGVR